MRTKPQSLPIWLHGYLRPFDNNGFKNIPDKINDIFWIQSQKIEYSYILVQALSMHQPK